MPLSTAAKAALCLCPPAAMVGTVATVPTARRAVHHLTAPRHAAKPVRRVATAAAHPQGEAARAAGCDPVAGPLPAVPLVTYAAPIPDEPVGGGGAGPVGGAPTGAVAAVQAPVAFGPVAAATPTPGATPTAPVPEPASWALMILGAGAVGIALRRWQQAGQQAGRQAGSDTRGYRIAGGAAASGFGAAAEAGDLAVTSVAAKSTLASVAGKAMLCACPAAVMAGSVVGVPPLRHAVHAATAPAPVRAASVPIRSIVPCSQPMPVPVSGAAVANFPDTVTTIARPA